MDELENIIGPHEHNFAEEQEESGRLMLGPCLSCGMAAADAMVKAEKEISDLSKEIAELKARVAERDADVKLWMEQIAEATRQVEAADNLYRKTCANNRAEILMLTQSNDAMREALKQILALNPAEYLATFPPKYAVHKIAEAAIQKEEK